MKIVLFGAGGGTGCYVPDQALGDGHQVAAVVRRPRPLAAYQGRVRNVVGDILVYSDGTGHILTAMRAAGVRRLEVVSAALAEPHENWA